MDDTALREFSEALEELAKPAASLIVIRIPGRRRYLKALGDAVEQSLQGVAPKEALKNAAQQWNALTDELGRDQQRRALSRSLDL